MASNTSRLNLLKKDPIVDGNDTFNIQTMLNENWDKVDQSVALIDPVTGKLIPGQENTPDVSGLATKEELNAHQQDDVSETEVHGMRVLDGKFEYFDGSEWQVVSGTGLPVANVSNFISTPDNAKVTLKWTDPNDLVIEGATVATWAGTKILRKVGSYPVNENDGVLVVDSAVRNQYQTVGFEDTGLTNETTYYYMAFPYTTDDRVTVNEVNRVSAMPVEQKIYGVRITKGNSNPSTRVVYIGDALGFTPMTGGNGNFSWGSWQTVFNNFAIRPCVLKAGVVQYYLNPSNFAQKVDGSLATITGADGDVMIEFGKPLWYKWTDEGTTYTIEVSDKSFAGAVKHAFELESGYNQFNYYPLLLTQILFVLFFKSTDSQTALGRGRVDGATGYASTGGTNVKGMFYGSSADEQMKFLGIEDYWGNKLQWIDGVVTDASYNILLGKSGFNDTGSGHQSFSSGTSANLAGYIDKVQGGSDKGFIIADDAGSDNTYYTDYGVLYSSRVAYFGGGRSDGSAAGFAGLQLSGSASSAGAIVGARLFCAANNKIYIGAYLGTTVSAKLRSVSGTAEPTGNKTIGSFRTEARANN